MGRCQSNNINWSLEENDSTLVNEFEDFKTSVKKVTTGVVEVVRELELEVKSGDMTESLLSNEKTKAYVELLLRDEQRNLLLKMKTTSGENYEDC